MTRATSFALALLTYASGGCTASPALDPNDPEPRLRLSGKPISQVIQALGNPDEVAEAQYFGTKFDDGPLAVVFKYSKDQLYVHINDKGIVIGVAKGSTKNFIKW